MYANVCKSKKLEDNASNILKSFHCTVTLMHRTMEWSNVVIMFEMFFETFLKPFLYVNVCKSKKLEDNASNILKSFHCTVTLMHRTMEWSNVVIMFEMFFCVLLSWTRVFT